MRLWIKYFLLGAICFWTPGQILANSATQQTSAAGQAQASSQQARAADSPSQSQAQSTPPCSDVHPILKRGTEPDLPPCPDQPQEAPPLNPAASLIERAREVAFEFAEKLPNFICEEFMTRYMQQGRQEQRRDVVSAEIIYDNEHETYRNVKIDGFPTDRSLDEVGGAWSTGEFASTLLDLFAPNTEAQFKSGGASTIGGVSAQVYDFQVRRENSHWRVQFEDSQTLTPAYQGSVWVDPKTARVLRVELQGRDIPSDFPIDTIESAVDYSYVTIGGESFLLPVRAESLGCQRGTNYCSHNVITFRNYHEFTSDIKIGPPAGAGGQ